MAKAKAAVAEKPATEEPQVDPETGMAPEPGPAKPGHNSGVAAEELKAFTERMLRLEDEKAAVLSDMKELREELKGRGFDVGAFNAVMKTIRERDKDKEKFEEKMRMADLYHMALELY